jgi:hypothetical protein
MGGMMMPMILAMLGVFMMTSMGGCDKDKDGNKKSKEQMINACLHDESGECQRKAAAWAAANPEQANMAAAALQQTDSDGNYLSSSVDNYTLKSQAAKVKAGLEADRNNPNSLYYDPDNAGTSDGPSNLARDTASDELPVAILPTSVDEHASAVIEGGGQPGVPGAAIK